jgi:hypothetical protein
MNNELLCGGAQEVPDVVLVHGGRILQNDDVTRRFLSTDDEFRNDGSVAVVGSDFFRSGFEVGMHPDYFHRRTAQAKRVLQKKITFKF